MEKRKIRYAVVGLGHIAQAAVLPAFSHAGRNSVLAALVSSDPEKLEALGRRYGVKERYTYDELEAGLRRGGIDAVYVATPNVLHRRFVMTAARHGVHALCEKPMATDEGSCMAMIKAAEKHRVKLMIGYRLHFDAANLHAASVARSRSLGELRIFNSVFTMRVSDRKNIRFRRDLGGGTLFDIGVYCVNAARCLFRAEPVEVFAMGVQGRQARFGDVDEMTSAILRFPGDRIAAFTASFGAADSSIYDLIGTKGRLRLDNAYDYAEPMEFRMVKDRKVRSVHYSRHDQFAAELLYFSDCILRDRTPEPSGWEGLADVRVINALLDSAKREKPQQVWPVEREAWPTERQRIVRPPLSRTPEPIHAGAPTR